MRRSPLAVLAIVAVLPVGACGGDDDVSENDTPSNAGTAAAQDTPIPTDAVDEDGNFVQQEVDEFGSVTIAGESFDLVVDECHLRESGPLAVLVYPDVDNELFRVTLNSNDDGPTLLVRSDVDDPAVPDFVAELANFKGAAPDLDFSSNDGINTYSGSNITIDDQGSGDPLTVERFDVTCADPGF